MPYLKYRTHHQFGVDDKLVTDKISPIRYIDTNVELTIGTVLVFSVTFTSTRDQFHAFEGDMPDIMPLARRASTTVNSRNARCSRAASSMPPHRRAWGVLAEQ